MIKDWSPSAPKSHLVGGMKYQDGKLTVPTNGRYYIYIQTHYHNNGRVYVMVNNNIVMMTQPDVSKATRGSLHAGGVFHLNAGDVIFLSGATYPTNTIELYMYSHHCFFGAFLI